jgi:hypothetical protein
MDGLGHAADGAGHYPATGQGCLENRQTEGLLAAGMQEDVRAMQELYQGRWIKVSEGFKAAGQGAKAAVGFCYQYWIGSSGGLP